jgi:nucleoside-diphosphate-sugar epimerase
MRRALIFGGSGQVGRAIAAALLEDGWQVDATTHAPALPTEIGAASKLQPARTRAEAIRAGRYDAVIDTMAFTHDDATDLLSARAAFGQLLVISTASVYADAAGNGFETGTFPDYPVEISEDQPTVPPGPGYSAGKVALEAALGEAATILRPAAIHGIGARHPREWWFVKRLLDGRTRIPIEHQGKSVFHTTSAGSIGSLAAFCLDGGHTGAFNVADPEALSVTEIAGCLAATLGRAVDLVPMDTLPGPLSHVGHSPFSVPRPLRLSTNKARALGWQGGARYQTLLPAYCNWLCRHVADWQTAFPAFSGYARDPFDYAAEDRVLADTDRNA